MRIKHLVPVMVAAAVVLALAGVWLCGEGGERPDVGFHDIVGHDRTGEARLGVVDGADRGPRASRRPVSADGQDREGRCTGMITNPDGLPISGVRVAIESLEGSGSMKIVGYALSDRTGRFVMALEPRVPTDRLYLRCADALFSEINGSTARRYMNWT